VRFKRRVRLETGLKQIDIAPLIDCVFLLLIFFMLTSSFIVVPGINVKLPKALTSEAIPQSSVTVTISSEDIIYVEDEVVLEDELHEYLRMRKVQAVFIKADRDSSLGTMVRVWDICKKLGIEKIGVATTYQ